jgi:hypothetical protein
MMIGAIETRYAGHLFRSRLEARWAVCFDAMDIKWQYEPQGFQFDDSFYLPDFYLPDFSTWVEVKGNPDGLINDLNRMSRFIGPASPLPGLVLPPDVPLAELCDFGYVSNGGLLILGDIPNSPGAMPCFPHINSFFANAELGVVEQMHCRRWCMFWMTSNKKIKLFDVGDGLLQAIHEMRPFLSHDPADLLNVESRLCHGIFRPEIDDAYQSARCARFEHGETPDHYRPPQPRPTRRGL